MMKIYADNAATTALSPAVLEEMMPYLTTVYGNPSSLYETGAIAKEAVETARAKIAALIGALLGFLIFNAHPAKVFMGDTGSLALGGFVTGMAYMLQLPLFIPIVGFIYFIEVLSVIIQVSYFKKTHGKRVFRMAPIHHHFEKGGWSETKVVNVFTTITILLCLLSYAGL